MPGYYFTWNFGTLIVSDTFLKTILGLLSFSKALVADRHIVNKVKEHAAFTTTNKLLHKQTGN